jgi:hypothetical protein
MSYSGCPFCGTAIQEVRTTCPYCKEELPEVIIEFLKNVDDKEISQNSTISEPSKLLEYIISSLFLALSVTINITQYPQLFIYAILNLVGKSLPILLYTVVYIKWGFAKSLPSIKYFPRDNGILVFSEFLLIFQIITYFSK